MNRSPILKALSSIRKSGAKTLLMGGQACVFYGAAEFSRDLDLIILVDSENLARLRSALQDLGAQPVAVPPLEPELLLRGHAVHFRCRREDVAGLRIDLMSSLREVAPFEDLWERRTTIEVEDEVIDLLSVQDLVKAKKTQRDKDWPMIRRLVERSYFEGEKKEAPTAEFWLRELRTPELLVRVAADHRNLALQMSPERPAIQVALSSDPEQVARALDEEEREERRRDRLYWEPLKRELEQLRRSR